jgi:hypothetical protein
MKKAGESRQLFGFASTLVWDASTGAHVPKVERIKPFDYTNRTVIGPDA